ncbi:hypothetical protein K474DRAFT_1414488 [Panus rudis PR-1116 ss-1]|nr:hypothetical protein K474DRAFT_1414488 [Panus rudis PR-1116 ss-1]
MIIKGENELVHGRTEKESHKDCSKIELANVISHVLRRLMTGRTGMRDWEVHSYNHSNEFEEITRGCSRVIVFESKRRGLQRTLRPYLRCERNKASVRTCYSATYLPGFMAEICIYEFLNHQSPCCSLRLRHRREAPRAKGWVDTAAYQAGRRLRTETRLIRSRRAERTAPR